MEQTNNSTETLFASFQAGNMAAFSQLYNLHINVIFNYGLKLTIDKELLQDCIHDVFVKLYTKRDELGVIDNVRSYLFISLKNKLCDELRRRMYGAQNETYIEDWAERISNLLIYKMLCKIWVDGSAKRNVYVGLICSYIYVLFRHTDLQIGLIGFT